MSADENGRSTEELRSAERRLQAAQLAGDADALELLLDDRLVFTGPDGQLYGKKEDLEIQRSGQQRLGRVDEEELALLVVGTTGVTWFLGTVAGTLGGQEFTARVRYTRTWVHTVEGGWRVVAAHVTPASAVDQCRIACEMAQLLVSLDQLACSA
ncbi:nuclear transport factor 2 family protein [Streptacidiphilus pinicola]|uniref:Nuclear transport factor 2 family protein n=1 Tax=Streptacidiphilus pinicola TaxID=2219663 RepID=A0A2X0IS24_9ACTN|nr:nuclear transport factor 2 family protein [Streptacidiphilus pinicola]RAG86413.1 nuclear transport factor 2 family protein [Streptacidiphilus pinicola]